MLNPFACPHASKGRISSYSCHNFRLFAVLTTTFTNEGMWTVDEQDDVYYIERQSHPPIARSNPSTMAASQTRKHNFRRTPRKSVKKLNDAKRDGICEEREEDHDEVRRRKQPTQRQHRPQDPIHAFTLVNHTGSTGNDVGRLKWLQQEDFSQSCFNIGDDLLVQPTQRPKVISHAEVMTSYEVSESMLHLPAAEATEVMETESWDLDSFSSGLSFGTSSSIFD